MEVEAVPKVFQLVQAALGHSTLSAELALQPLRALSALATLPAGKAAAQQLIPEIIQAISNHQGDGGVVRNAVLTLATVAAEATSACSDIHPAFTYDLLPPVVQLHAKNVGVFNAAISLASVCLEKEAMPLQPSAGLVKLVHALIYRMKEFLSFPVALEPLLRALNRVLEKGEVQ